MTLVEHKPATAPAETSAASTTRNRWRPLLMRLHFYAGIFAAPFILVGAITGLLYTITPRLDDLAYGDQLHVSEVGTERLPVSAQIAAAQETVPADLTVSSVVLPAGDDDTTRVVFADPTLTDDRERTVFVDPYTGAVQGDLVTWFDYTPLMTWFDDLHRNLHLGEFGRYYSEVAASWIGVLAVSGAILWLVQRRRKRLLRKALLPEFSGPGRRRMRSWHATVGVWALVGMLFLSVTGLTWSRHAGANFTETLESLDATAPSLDTALPEAGAPAGAGVENVDRVVDSARNAGLDGPIIVSVASEAGTAWSVAQDDNVWPIRKDQVAVDPRTGEVTAHNHWSDRPLLSKLSSLGVQAHMAILFGPVNQIALAALALGIIAMIVWGYRMWWLRRPTKVVEPPTAAEPGPLAIVVVGGLAVLVGAAVPVLGASLLLFLLVDAVFVGPLRTRRARA